MNWYYRLNDTENGPLTEETIREIHRCGVLNDDTTVRAEDSEHWLPYAQVLGHNSTRAQGEQDASSNEVTEIKFSCPHCEQHMSTESSSAGLAAICPSCGSDIVVPSADNVLPKPSRTLPPEGLKIGHSESSKDVSENIIGSYNKPLKKFPKIAVGLGLIFVIFGITVIYLMWGGMKDDSNNLYLTSRTNSQSKYMVGASFWKFRFGQSYEESVDTMKILKARGDFSNIQIASARGWMPDASKVLFGYGSKGTDLDGTLSIPCNGIFLLFKQDVLHGIELTYTFKLLSTHVLKQTNDMERAFGLKASHQDKTDELGNVTRTIILEGPNVGVKIVDILDEKFSPNIRIFARQ